MFCGRQNELETLNECFQSNRSQLVVIYGRRRVGKSRLVEKFVEGKHFFAFEALEGGRTDVQIQHFTQTLRKQLNDPILDSVNFRSWEAVFDFLNEKLLGSKERTVVFFDEFQWMAAGQSHLVSVVKFYWDKHWKNKNVMLILCGSIASFMVNKVIKSSALYGRITKEILLTGLAPKDVVPFFKNKRGKEEILKYLLVFGGIPKYLEEIDLNKSFHKNMNELCFTPHGYMLEEFEKIFYAQFKETKIYTQIVKLLKDKLYSLDDLSKKIGLPSGGGLKNYLTNLENAEIIKCIIPFGNTPNTKFKKYKLTDEYLCFYFKYIEPNKITISHSFSNKLFETVSKNNLDVWFGFAFERFCLKHANLLAQIMGFHDEVLDAAPYFAKGENQFQIDMLYKRTSNIITLCEMKFHNKPIGTGVIPEVEKKRSLFPLPYGYTLENSLISPYGPDDSLKAAEYFHHHVTLNDFFQ